MNNAKDVYVADILREVYDGVLMSESEKNNNENHAFDRAYHALEARDRVKVDGMINTMCEAFGRNFGRGSALQVLAKLGMFLREVEP